MPKTAAVVTIKAGQSLSNSVALTGAVGMLIAPANGPPTKLSFQVSPDGVSYSDLFDASGQQVSLTLARGTARAVPPTLTQQASFVRLRTPVAQPNDISFTLLLI